MGQRTHAILCAWHWCQSYKQGMFTEQEEQGRPPPAYAPLPAPVSSQEGTLLRPLRLRLLRLARRIGRQRLSRLRQNWPVQSPNQTPLMHALTRRAESTQTLAVACDAGMHAHAGCADACAGCGARMCASIWPYGTVGRAALTAGGAESAGCGSVRHACCWLSVGLHSVQG